MKIDFLLRAGVLAIAFATPALAHDKLVNLFEFNQDQHDYPGGGYPNGGIVTDAHGAIYGTTPYGGPGPCVSGYGCGTVFALSPPARGSKQWSFRILYSFLGGQDGKQPSAPLTLGPNGSLFGYAGGSTEGTVFQLLPPSQQGQPWTFQIFYVFQGGSDGDLATTTPLVWNGQALFGVAYGSPDACGQFGCGSVFQLSPQPNGGWTKTTVFAFTGGADGAFPGAIAGPDSNGALYVATGQQYSAVVQLSPPSGGGQWNETILTAFKGGKDGTDPANLILSADGTLYGTASVGATGLAFQLANGSNGWTRTNIAYIAQKGGFQKYGPDSLAAGPNGTLVGAILGDYDAFSGAVFQLSPPDSGKTWTYTELCTFNREQDHQPVNVVEGKGGDLFVVVNGGGTGAGGLFELH
jgi:hypothetical protein